MDEKTFKYLSFSEKEQEILSLDLFHYYIRNENEVCNYKKLHEDISDVKKIKEHSKRILEDYISKDNRTLFADVKLIGYFLDAYEDLNRAEKNISQRKAEKIQKEVKAVDEKIQKEDIIIDYGTDFEKHPWVLAQRISETLSGNIFTNIYDKESVHEEVMQKLMTKEGRAALINELCKSYYDKQEGMEMKLRPQETAFEMELIKNTLTCISYIDAPELVLKENEVKKDLETKKVRTVKEKESTVKKDTGRKKKEQPLYSAYFYDSKSKGDTHYSYATENHITFKGNTLKEVFDKIDSYNNEIDKYNEKADPDGTNYTVRQQKVISAYIGKFNAEENKYVYNPQSDDKYNVSTRKKADKVKPIQKTGEKRTQKAGLKDFNGILDDLEKNGGKAQKESMSESKEPKKKQVKKGTRQGQER